jgi:hypothetical protein
MRAGLPRVFVDVISNWYQKLSVVVRWNGCDSSPLRVLSGVRQGGILSPILFNLYVNCFLTSLRKCGLGCHIQGIYIGCIMYADDLLLLSASVLDLQSMLDKCGCIGQDLDINFNCCKSKCMIIGPHKVSKILPMSISNAMIEWVDSIKYLGIVIKSDKLFNVDLKDSRRKFFISFNSIINKCKYASDIVKLQLLESHCLPILMYSLECLNLTPALIKEVNCWWNAVYRRIFGYNKWESVKEVICRLGRLDIHHLLNQRHLLFMKRVAVSNNSIMTALNYHFFT